MRKFLLLTVMITVSLMLLRCGKQSESGVKNNFPNMQVSN